MWMKEKRDIRIKALEREIAGLDFELRRLRKACVTNCNMGLDGYCSEVDIQQANKILEKQIKQAEKKRNKYNVQLTKLKRV